ncbi:hypothetical protein K438DRAFT_1953547 [Mycena galopus ATCC 62051]|nr:hypothetical protein K438DRAFT_1953547 [Mycena galopus ATCC 62051]
MSPIPALLRTAVDLKSAVDNAALYLTPIGTCHSKTAEWRNEEGLDEEEDEEEPDEKVGVQVMKELYALQHNYMATVASGDLKNPQFSLTITRAGCEYEGEISVSTSKDDILNERLRKWYEGGAVSGYGDVKAQETKVDPNVRHAREIPASEFRVSPALIAQVEELWGTSFFPTHVRADPYKIHLYGPGGKFKTHRDTPETDLVGTFLVGLGDTCNVWDGALEIANSKGRWPTHHHANPGSWVAFYPDVAHSVREITDGYRAVIAFKIFRRHLDTPEVPADVTLRHKIKDVLTPLQKPYGILLRHQYSAGTAELNGLDAVLYAAVGETGGDVKLLPVLIRWIASRTVDFGYGDAESKSSADVFPMTTMHVDAILDHIRAGEKQADEDEEESKSKRLFVDLKGTDAEWINYQSTTSIPFYSPDFDATALVWKEETQDAIEHTGNESRPQEEDSIYLSYAIVVLPVERGTKRAASEEGDP